MCNWMDVLKMLNCNSIINYCILMKTIRTYGTIVQHPIYQPVLGKLLSGEGLSTDTFRYLLIFLCTYVPLSNCVGKLVNFIIPPPGDRSAVQYNIVFIYTVKTYKTYNTRYIVYLFIINSSKQLIFHKQTLINIKKN